ncbi:MAG: sterol desaturase family protein [Gemmatimonadales bacterium]|nr:sterol desaturase family protein [Gemmatimonadales bacterium]
MVNKKQKGASRWLITGLTVAWFAGLVWLERRQGLRDRQVESKLRRDVRNLAVGGFGAIALHVAERPIVVPLARLVRRRRWGLLQQMRLPPWAETVLAVVLMDYTLYLWHVLVHKVPWLWRFHLVHHADLDMDASTALRFHFAELAVSVPWRAAQVAAIGVSPPALSAWQTFLFCSILFHHSNVRLPIGLERRLSRWVVTPRLHGIHHSMLEDEANSNWSSGLTLWDWLHGTLRRNVAQPAIVIGVPGYRDPAELTLPDVLALPFGEERLGWDNPDGTRSVRTPTELGPPSVLQA